VTSPATVIEAAVWLQEVGICLKQSNYTWTSN